MEIKVGATDDGNSTSGTLSSFRQRSDINVGGSFDMSLEALVAREIEKRKIKEEIMTYGYLKRRELEEEVIRELILERESATRQAEGVSVVNAPLYSLQSGLRGLISNNRDVVALRERPALVMDGGGIKISLANRLEGGMDARMPRGIHVEDVIDGVLPLGNRLDDSVNGRLSMVNRPDGRISDGLPFRRQPGFMSGVASKPVIDLRKAVPLAKPKTSDASLGSKRKLETPTVDCDDRAALGGKGKKLQKWWSCELCQVKATSEQGMKDHLNGKKHKTKEKAMQITTKSVSNCFYESDSPTEENEKSSEHTISIGTTSPNPSNIVGGNQDRRNVEALNPKQHHADTNCGFGLEEKQVKNDYTDFKFWCKMCEVGTTSKASLTTHRMGKRHMSLLKEKGKSVSNCSNESDSPTEETEKSSELTIPTATTSPSPTNTSNIVGGNQDRRNVEALNPNQQHADTNCGFRLEEKRKTEKVKNDYTDFKFWCKMCEVGTTSEASLTTHRMGKKHMSLLKEKGKSVSNCSNESDSPMEENEKSSELTIPTATTSPNPSSIVGGNQDRRNVEVLNPKQQHADTNCGFGLGEKQKTEKVKNNCTDFKFWCKMCEVGTTSETTLTIHRMGKKHMCLLKEKGGGVIGFKTMPDDVQYVGLSRNITANKEKEVSLGNGDGYGGGVGADDQETTRNY